MIEIHYSEKYKNYKSPQLIADPKYYIQEIIDDAANVLVVKILNTIDMDPDPYSLLYPFKPTTKK